MEIRLILMLDTPDTMVNAVDEAYVQGRRRQVARVVLFMSLFHSIATMLIPAVAIHEAVHLAVVLLKRAAAGGRLALLALTLLALVIREQIVVLQLLGLLPLRLHVVS